MNMSASDPGVFGPGGWLSPIADEFLQAYRVALQPEVLTACLIAKEAERTEALKTLAFAGAVIDVPIMVWLWHPYWTMLSRAYLGLTWVPSALMDSSGGGSGPVPPGAVKVIDPRDRAQWPASFNPPAPPPVSGNDLVGKRNPVWDWQGLGLGYDPGKDIRNPDGTYKLADGQEHSEDGATFVFHIRQLMIGQSYFFTLKA